MGFTSTASGSHAVAIGSGTIATSAFSVAMGAYNASYGNPLDWVATDPILQIGIGTSTANRKNALTILKNGQAHIPHGVDASLNTNGFLMLGNPSGHNVIIDDNEIMARNNGQAAPIYINLEGGYTYLGGSIYIPGVLSGTGSNMKIDINSKTVHWDSSSKRYKENIQTLEDDWTKILQTTPVKYTRPQSPDQWEIGYIAEEFDSIGLSALVGFNKEGQPEYLQYDRMVVYLTEMLKIQDQKIASQEDLLSLQQEKIFELKAILEGLHQRSDQEAKVSEKKGRRNLKKLKTLSLTISQTDHR